MDNIHILILDDEASIRWVLKRTLAEAGYEVHEARNPGEARDILKKQNVHLAFVDINLPQQDGLSFARILRKRYPKLLCIIMTGEGRMEHAVEAMKIGAYDYITKPFDIQNIEEITKNAVKTLTITHQNPAKTRSRAFSKSRPLDLLVGNSKAMRELYKLIGRVAPTQLSVLIQGESGTGKELVARSIHQHSQRAKGHFVALNCAAIPSELLESELFGHEKGSFTGATERKIGKVETASKGTLFLDEIGDMPLALQGKLLRVLQERCFERVGGRELIPTEMRVIAATHRNLRLHIEDSCFRADLYYRLNVFPIEVPPLREHPEDIPALIEHFLFKGEQEMAISRRTITPEAIEVLSHYYWKGNVREIENLIKSLMVFSVGGAITVDMLPAYLKGPLDLIDDGEPLEKTVARKLPALISQYVNQGNNDLFREILQHVERPLLEVLLEETSWNQQKTARILGINRNTLRKKISILGIKRHP